nr:MAG TPA: hypothetical protein [Caudoviricetes sp.]
MMKMYEASGENSVLFSCSKTGGIGSGKKQKQFC